MNQTISYLRNAAIIAIVLHHSMVAFCGWPPNHAIGGNIPQLSFVLSDLFKVFGLGIFTFISGFCLCYQAKKKENFSQFLRKKMNRIIFPCLFWACIYGVFFRTYMYSTWPSIINGTHLWYLPMLFLCILVTSLHFYTRRAYVLIGICYAGILFLAVRTHFRTFVEFYQFYPVFYAGFFLNKKGLDTMIQKNKKYMLLAGLGGDSVDVQIGKCL